MKRIIIYFLILLFSVWLGVTIYRDPGYILVSYHGWSVETSLWFAIVILVLLFLVFYMLLRFSSGVISIAARIKQWFSNRHKNNARKQTISGLYDFVEGNWADAEKKLLSSANYSDMPLINYLAAAFVAQQQQEFKQRDNYLLLAQKTGSDHPIAVGLTQARLQIFNQQWEEALATLQHLQQLRPNNTLILQLLEQIYLELKDWYSLKLLLPDLHKHHAFDNKKIDQLELLVYKELLLASVTNNSIETKWTELSRHLKNSPVLVAIYAKHLLNTNQVEEAESILKTVLHKELDEHLLELYAMLPSTNPIKKIARAEKWLTINPENAALLLNLGRICKQQKLWGKAKQYLEKSMQLNPTTATYFELGQLMEIQSDLHKALDLYNKGLKIAIDKQT